MLLLINILILLQEIFIYNTDFFLKKMKFETDNKELSDFIGLDPHVFVNNNGVVLGVESLIFHVKKESDIKLLLNNKVVQLSDNYDICVKCFGPDYASDVFSVYKSFMNV